MHELPVAESLLEIATRHARSAGASKVVTLNIVIGQLSSIIDDSVQFYWDIIAENSPAEGARLIFRRIPTELLCLDCNCQYIPGDGELTCPKCSGSNVKIVAGKEFYLESIEVE